MFGQTTVHSILMVFFCCVDGRREKMSGQKQFLSSKWKKLHGCRSRTSLSQTSVTLTRHLALTLGQYASRSR